MWSLTEQGRNTKGLPVENHKGFQRNRPGDVSCWEDGVVGGEVNEAGCPHREDVPHGNEADAKRTLSSSSKSASPRQATGSR